MEGTADNRKHGVPAETIKRKWKSQSVAVKERWMFEGSLTSDTKTKLSQEKCNPGRFV